MLVKLGSDHFGPEGRTDFYAQPFYDVVHDNSPIVKSIEVDWTWALHFRFSAGYELFVKTDPVGEYEPYEEQWRFMTPDYHTKGHLVLRERQPRWGDPSDLRQATLRRVD